MNFLISLLILLIITTSASLANNGNPLTGTVSDPLVDAQERLLHAKGNYKSIRLQEAAIKDMRKATKLSLKASNLRARAEKLQAKADLLVNKANQQALSRGLYITSPLSPVMMQPPLQDQTAKAPVPGHNINIVLPRQEEVSENTDTPPVPATNSF